MSGTNASLSASGGGVILPAPVVRSGVANPSPPPYEIPDAMPRFANGGVAVGMNNVVSVSVHGLSAEIMTNLDKYKPQLELLRYVRRRTSRRDYARGRQNNGYVHPSNAALPSGDGSHTHGGAHSFITPYVAALRVTEWLVTTWGQEIDVTQSLLAFMHLERVIYRDSSGNTNNTGPMPVPSGATTNTGLGKRYPYSGVFYPAYFKLRWSIIDPTDGRGQRVTGPTSEVVSLTTNVFPFTPLGAVDVGGVQKAVCDVVPGHDPLQMRAWVGASSRLPR